MELQFATTFLNLNLESIFELIAYAIIPSPPVIIIRSFFWLAPKSLYELFKFCRHFFGSSLFVFYAWELIIRIAFYDKKSYEKNGACVKLTLVIIIWYFLKNIYNIYHFHQMQSLHNRSNWSFPLPILPLDFG